MRFPRQSRWMFFSKEANIIGPSGSLGAAVEINDSNGMPHAHKCWHKCRVSWSRDECETFSSPKHGLSRGASESWEVLQKRLAMQIWKACSTRVWTQEQMSPEARRCFLFELKSELQVEADKLRASLGCSWKGSRRNRGLGKDPRRVKSFAQILVPRPFLHCRTPLFGPCATACCKIIIGLRVSLPPAQTMLGRSLGPFSLYWESMPPGPTCTMRLQRRKLHTMFSKQTFRKNVVAWKNGAGWREFRRKTERTTKKYHETEGKWHCFLQKTSNDAIRRNSAQKTPLAPHAIVQYFFLARPQLQVQYTLTCMRNDHRFPTCQHKYRVTVAFRPNGMSLAKGFCWGLGFAGLVASWVSQVP